MTVTEGRVSVILPTFNRAAYIAASLDSLLRQTVPPYQVIVVNDGSTDHTEQVLAPCRDRITYLSKENAGKPAAINAALPYVEGDYIWVFDDDDVACTDALERHLAVLAERPEIGFTFSSAYYASSDASGELRVERTLVPRQFPEDDFLAELLLECYTASPSVVVRTSVQKAAGAYNTQLVRSQDWEIALRWSLIAPAARLPDSRPTYYRRFHAGVRGPQGGQFPDAERVTRARELNRHIFRNVATYIKLHHYLPYSQWNEPLSTERERMALSRRLGVRLRNGLWEEALEDLDALGAIGFPRGEMTEGEFRFLRRGLSNDDAIDELRDAGLEAQFRKYLNRPRLRPVRHALVKGLYYNLRREMAHRRWNKAWAVSSTLSRLVGLGGMGSEASRNGPKLR